MSNPKENSQSTFKRVLPTICLSQDVLFWPGRFIYLFILEKYPAERQTLEFQTLYCSPAREKNSRESDVLRGRAIAARGISFMLMLYIHPSVNPLSSAYQGLVCRGSNLSNEGQTFFSLGGYQCIHSQPKDIKGNRGRPFPGLVNPQLIVVKGFAYPKDIGR